MSKPKRKAYTALGWVAWQALAKVGVPMAKNKLKKSGGRGPGAAGGTSTQV